MDDASDELRICPFLRAVGDDIALGDPIRRPDEANRCTALGDGAPQSLRQQEYACLSSAHVNCPRFERGALLLVEPAPAHGSSWRLTPAIVAALVVLAASFALSIGFVVANGGMELRSAASPSAPVALASGAASAGASGAADPGESPDPAANASPPLTPSDQPVASPEPSPATTPAPTVAPTATRGPTPTATRGPTAGPTSDRYALLKPCPDAPDCWIYVVRPGDNLVSIARYFGISLDVVTARNPTTKTTPLVAGQELSLPPPTR